MPDETSGFADQGWPGIPPLPDAASLDRLAGMAGLGPSRWRKLPVEIEAAQWNPGDLAAAGAVVGWLTAHGAIFRHPSGTGETTTLAIETLEGEMLARPGWWVIRGVAGEFYPCDPDVFARTYELADSPRPTPGPSAALHADGQRTGAGTERQVTVSREDLLTVLGADWSSAAMHDVLLRFRKAVAEAERGAGR